jgi:hypothetical protein
LIWFRDILDYVRVCFIYWLVAEGEKIMSQDQLAAVAGVVISLLFSYIPAVNTWYAGLGDFAKRLIMIVVLAIVSGGVFGVSCLGLAPWLNIDVTCDASGAWAMLMLFFEAVVANQATHLITPDTKKVEIAKRKN